MILKILILGLFSLLLMAGCAPKESNVIKIGLVAPLTGDQAEIGIDEQNGAQLAVDEVNAKGGLLGKKVVLVPLDDKHDPKEAVNAANKLVSDPAVVGVVGHLNSGTSIPASAVYNRAGIAMISPSATNPQLTRQGFKNVFRVCTTDEVQGPAMADFLVKDKKFRKIVILHDKSAYGQGLADTFKVQAEKNGATILLYEGITQGDKDFSAVLTKIKGLNPDVIYFGGMHSEGGLLARQGKDLGLRAAIAGGDGMFGTEFSKVAGPAARKAYVSFLAPPFEKLDSAKGFVDAYTAKYGPIKQYAPYAYDAAKVMLEAIEKAGSTHKDAIIKAVAETKEFPGVTGKISFDENGDTTNKRFYFYTFDSEGKPVLVK